MTTSLNPFVKICIIGFLALLSYTLARFPVIPLYAESLKLSPEQIGLVVSASTLSGVFFKLPSGILSDVFGRRIMILISVCFFAFTGFFYFLANDGLSLFVIRMIHGLSTAIWGPVVSAFISDIASPKNRGQLLSTYSSANMLGRTIGPLLGGWLLFWGGYKFPFLASGVVGILALLVALGLPETKVSKSHEKQFSNGLKTILLNKAIILISIVECLQFLATGGLECFLPIFSKNVVHLTEWQIGILFGAQVIVTMLLKPFLGILSDKFGRKHQIFIGLLLGGLTFMLIPYFKYFLAILILVSIYGFTIAVVTSATSAFVTDLASKEKYGAAHGVFGTIMDIGHASGPILGGILVAKFNFNFLFLIFGLILITYGMIFWFVINKMGFTKNV